MTEIRTIIEKQRAFYNSGQTKDVSYRIKQLKILKHAIEENEEKILQALHEDLRKSPYEAYLTEVGIVLDEIGYMVKKVQKWSRPKRVGTPIYHFPAASYIYPEPYGISLIISPWNYPFQLAVAPLAAAMAAGNCAVIKPSEFSVNTSQVLAELFDVYFDPVYISVITGDADVSTALLAEKFDYIFFTGSPAVGKIVMTAAAEYLTPVTLELGGKSPCIIDQDANIEIAAKRIVSGKFINAGQTCIAPDYLMVHQSVKEPLVDRMIHYIQKFYGTLPTESPDYPKIINQKHFNRLLGLTKDATIMCGGAADSEQQIIAPTLLSDVDDDHPSMQEEIFGPVLPVMEFDNLSDAISRINGRPRPLALYMFSNNQSSIDAVLKNVSFGGGCINDTLIHFATPNLPFGGVGNSGMGGYHGKFGFDTFSHLKSVMRNTVRFDFPFRYPTFYKFLKLLKLVLR
ncbi:MAG: aldehyde dehydrogenase [Desulfobacteraceae bacterium]|nr:aldehyde dehydrogenase [Desulfobacteraceae bacterium]